MKGDSASTLAAWAAVASALAGAFAAYAAWRASETSKRQVETALADKRARLAAELYETIGEIADGSEAVPPGTMKRLNDLAFECRLYFPAKPTRYIDSLIAAAYAYASHDSRSTVSAEYKALDYRAAMIKENLVPWINPYRLRPNWIIRFWRIFQRWCWRIQGLRRLRRH